MLQNLQPRHHTPDIPQIFHRYPTDIPEASGPTPKPMTLPTKEPEIEPPVRRSTRIRKPPKKYNPAEYDLS